MIRPLTRRINHYISRRLLIWKMRYNKSRYTGPASRALHGHKPILQRHPYPSESNITMKEDPPMLSKLLVQWQIMTAERKLKKASRRRERLDNEYRRYAIRNANSAQTRALGDQAKMAIGEELALEDQLHDLKRRQ